MKTLALTSILFFLSAVTFAGEFEHIVKLKSKYSVSETMDRLEKTAKSQGMNVFARIDFGKMGEKSKVKIPPNQLLIFGKGRGGPKLISASPSASLDLPLRAAAWEDKNGNVWVSYTSADAIKDRHNIEGKDKVIAKINSRLKSIADEALK